MPLSRNGQKTDLAQRGCDMAWVPTAVSRGQEYGYFRCDCCGAESGQFAVPIDSTRRARAICKHALLESDFILSGVKCLCFSCDGARPTFEQLALFSLSPKLPMRGKRHGVRRGIGA